MINQKVFEKINGKREELVKAQIANDNEWANSVRKEINLLINLYFYDEDGNLLIMEG